MEKRMVNGEAYRIERLLGRGKGGYSYLAYSPGGEAVVLKQIHHEPCDYYQFGDKLAAEEADYRTLHTLGLRMPRLLAVDRGRERLVKEYICGPTVFELVDAGALPVGAEEQVAAMCGTVYAAGLNIDWFPTNFVWDGKRLYYIDFECNPYAEQWNFENWGRLYWSRTPEFLKEARRQRAGDPLREK